MSELQVLLTEEVPSGRSALLESHNNLQKVASYCAQKYIDEPNKKNALEETKNFTTQSLASVAYQINTLASNMLHMLDIQATQLANMDSSINNISQDVDIHKEKVARREIGLLTTNKVVTRTHQIVAPTNPDRPTKYVRKPIDFSELDDIGHGVKLSQQPSTGATRRPSAISSKKSPNPSVDGLSKRDSIKSNVSGYGTLRAVKAPTVPQDYGQGRKLPNLHRQRTNSNSSSGSRASSTGYIHTDNKRYHNGTGFYGGPPQGMPPPESMPPPPQMGNMPPPPTMGNVPPPPTMGNVPPPPTMGNVPPPPMIGNVPPPPTMGNVPPPPSTMGSIPPPPMLGNPPPPPVNIPGPPGMMTSPDMMPLPPSIMSPQEVPPPPPLSISSPESSGGYSTPQIGYNGRAPSLGGNAENYAATSVMDLPLPPPMDYMGSNHAPYLGNLGRNPSYPASSGYSSTITENDGIPPPPSMGEGFLPPPPMMSQSPDEGFMAQPSWAPKSYMEKMVVIYDYSAENDDELNLREDQIVYVVKMNDDGWYEGVLDGRTGLFPGNYAEPVSA